MSRFLRQEPTGTDKRELAREEDMIMQSSVSFGSNLKISQLREQGVLELWEVYKTVQHCWRQPEHEPVNVGTRHILATACRPIPINP